MTRHGLSPAERYWLYIPVMADPRACLEWTGGIDDKGYGTFWDCTYTASGHRRSAKAHRFGWKLAHGTDPGELSVCHTCDNPPCQNPTHWFLDTHAGNMADRNAKGRAARVIGEANSNCKITDADVERMRALFAAGGTTKAALARQFGVSRQHVGRLLDGRRS